MTAFSQSNWDKTHAAHLAAREQFYPKLWPNAVKIEYLDTTGATADLKYGIDVIVAVTSPDTKLRGPIKFFIQERFREPYYRKFGDATITEWNTVTNLPSELHKIAAHIFVYGYYDPARNLITEAVAIDVPRILHEIAKANLKYSRSPRVTNDQTFIGIDFKELRRVNAIMHSTLHLSTNLETLPDLVDDPHWENTLFGPMIRRRNTNG
jgi:hypothetical protein